MIHLVSISLRQSHIFAYYMLIHKYFVVNCIKVAIFFRRYHRHILNIFSKRYQSWLILLKIEMNVDKYFLFIFGYCQLELALVPSFTNPANVAKQVTSHRVVFTRGSHLKSIYLKFINWVEICALSFSYNQKSFWVYVPIIAFEMKTQ